MQTDMRDLIDKALAAFNAMTPEQQAIHRRDQMRSWVRGNLGVDAPDSEWPAICARVEALLGKDGT
ncbi:MAG: hypothetical protein INF12_14760 [Methylobacterium sp.]|nr:hypothetical protein [Methylobacterium sp.]